MLDDVRAPKHPCIKYTKKQAVKFSLYSCSLHIVSYLEPPFYFSLS